MAVLHQQTTPATLWLITHNLGRVPMVQVISSSGEVIMAAAVELRRDTVRVEFNTPQTGSVLLL